ncbi:MAG: 50S ribosomal protein L15e [Candidatus Woesearchaeota archaeon]
MGIYKYVREIWKQPNQNMKEILQQRLIKWRKEPVTLRLERPTRIDRARSLGYKAKQGYLIIRQRVNRSKRMKPGNIKGRKSKRMSRRKDLNLSYQTVAEIRANKKYPNCEVLNSYYLNEDGRYYWYEVILVDRAHPAILSDDRINWIGCSQHRGRVNRGLTSSGKKSRGLGHKGKGAEKLRPSKSAVYRNKMKKRN